MQCRGRGGLRLLWEAVVAAVAAVGVWLATAGLEANHAISMPSKTGEPFHTLVGTDTFRGTATQAQLSRTQLYEKNLGDTRVERTGLVRTDSPVSGILMLHAQPHRHAVKDPIAGSTLQYHGSKAVVTAPIQKQQMNFSRNFYLTKDVDVTIQTLRNTNKVSRYTNEKVGTSGTPTGMDSTLVSYQAAR